MSYTRNRKLGIRKIEAAAGEIGVLSQRLHLFEQIVTSLLKHEGLALAMTGGGFDLVRVGPAVEYAAVPQPTEDELRAQQQTDELNITILDDETVYEDVAPEVHLPLTPSPEND